MVSRGTGSAILSGPGEGRLGTALSESRLLGSTAPLASTGAARGEGVADAFPKPKTSTKLLPTWSRTVRSRAAPRRPRTREPSAAAAAWLDEALHVFT